MKLLRIPTAIRDAMVAQAVAELPNECCGLLAGRGDTVTQRFPLVNELASPTRFQSSAMSMFQATKAIRRLELDVLAVYHSHPTSYAVPSRRDVEEANWPGVVTVIVSLKCEPVLRAWWLEGDGFTEIETD